MIRPVAASISNSASSPPGTKPYARSFPSESVAVTGSPTAVPAAEFSATSRSNASAPNAGATFGTLTRTAGLSARLPGPWPSV